MKEVTTENNAGNVFVTLSMSLDGFIAGPGDDVGRVFEWYFSGDTDYEMPSGRRVLKISSASTELVRELFGVVKCRST